MKYLLIYVTTYFSIGISDEQHDFFVIPLRYFNPIQSESFDTAFASDVNMLISAPTGCGKTAIMEMTLCRMIGICRQHMLYAPPVAESMVTSSECAQNSTPKPSTAVPMLSKAIYIAPTKGERGLCYDSHANDMLLLA
jgi:replicative superfamily II helicase